MADQVIRDFWQAKRASAGLVERRALEPIVSALLTQNIKAAVLACQKALRTKPYSPSVQALFAIALYRQGNSDAALEVVEEVAQDVKGKGKALQDANLLLLCSYVFEQFGKEQTALVMWEAALAQHSADLHLVLESTYYFVRIGAIQTLKETCRRAIHTSFRSESAPGQTQTTGQFFWSYVTAVIILLNDLSETGEKIRITAKGEAPSAEQVYRDLEEAVSLFRPGSLSFTSQSNADANKEEDRQHEPDASICSNAHEFYLLLRLFFHLCNAPAEALHAGTPTSAKAKLFEILRSEQGKSYAQKDLRIDLFARELCLKFGGTDTLKELFDSMLSKLEAGDNNWATVQTAIDAAYTAEDGLGNVKPATGDEAERTDLVPKTWWNLSASDDVQSPNVAMLIKLKAQLESLGQTECLSKKDRGYTLGQLHLASRFPALDVSLLPDLVILYIKRHADKACCFTDLEPYLGLMDQDGCNTVDQWLRTIYPQSEINVDNLKDLECWMTAEKVRRFVQYKYKSLEEELQTGHRLARGYFAALHFGKDLLVTDLQPADDLALLSAQCYLAGWELSRQSSEYLELAIAILEFALKRSKYRFQMRVLLVCLYRLAGAPSLILKHFRIMDTKQIQIDTLSHWALERATTYFAGAEAGKQATPLIIDGEVVSIGLMLEQSAGWYNRGLDEAAFSLAQAWNNQAFYLLEDCVHFRDRLHCSLVKAALQLDVWRALVMRMSLDVNQLKAGPGYLADLCDTEKPLHDNRDYSILPSHQPSLQADVRKQTSLGPKTKYEWVQKLAHLHFAFLTPEPSTLDKIRKHPSFTQDEVETTSLTSHELRVCNWASDVLPWLTGEEAKMEDAKILALLKDFQAEVAQREVHKPLWETLHIAQMALEVYCLLDLAFIAKSSSPGNFKALKQFKQIRQDSKGSMKSIASRLKVMNDELAKKYKGRTKLEPLGPLKEHEAIADEFLMDVATQLLEGRKTALTNLANAILKRIAGM